MLLHRHRGLGSIAPGHVALPSQDPLALHVHDSRPVMEQGGREGRGRGGEDSFPILRPKLPGYVLLYYVHTNVPPPGGVRERASLRIPNREVGSIVETALDGGDGQYPLSLSLSSLALSHHTPPPSLSCVRGCVTKLTYPRRAVRGAPSLSLPTPQDQGQDPDR